MPGGKGRIVDPEVVASIIGQQDLRDGLCAHHDPLVWSGPWFGDTGGGKEGRERRRRQLERAVSLCRSCPVLAACEEQLQAFEDAECRVDGVMAARQWGQRPQAEQVHECLMCHKPMHIRPWNAAPPVIPTGHVFAQARGLCSTCYSQAKRTGDLEKIGSPSHQGIKTEKTGVAV